METTMYGNDMQALADALAVETHMISALADESVPAPLYWWDDTYPVFASKTDAEAFCVAEKAKGNTAAWVGSLSGMVMTSDNSPIVVGAKKPV
jgi:hypothetical protein